jgi:hypothetical protein
MCVLQNPLGLATRAQGISRGQKPMPGDARRIVGKEWMIAWGIGEAIFKPALDIDHLGIGIKTDTHIELTPRQHAGRPITAFDLADHDTDRVVDPGERFLFAFWSVPLLLQAMQCTHSDGQASIAFCPVPATETCTGIPRTVICIRITPTWVLTR